MKSIPSIRSALSTLSLLSISLTIGSTSILAAQDAPAAAARKEARAARITAAPPALDGRLDDEAWALATPLTDFSQKEPTEGAAPSERTEVRFLYDDDALWVGARMYSSDPKAIQAHVSRRDVGGQSEFVTVSIDSYHDRRTAYTFGVTAGGTRIDRYHPRDAPDGDDTFSPVWEAKVARDSAGWTAEMRIPLSQLRFSPGSRQTWGLNVNRWIPNKEEDVYWTVIPRSVTAFASRFGELGGIDGVRPSRRVELSPYVATGAAFTSGVHPRDPFHEAREASVRMGADLKVGLGPNLTLDATVNPDFRQVDADPAEVNLSAFETFFAERRPFFTEGSQLLAGGGAGYFYSRRIGGPPRGAAAGHFVDRPEATTILGAAKLTGRLPSGLSVGVLAAVTDRERALTFDTLTGIRDRVDVEPLTGYGVARLQQEFGPAGSTVGATLTAVGRRMDDDSPLAARLGTSAVTGGVDGTLRLAGGTYEVTGAAGFSHVAGDPAAILRLQTSSARYFQRPDATYVEIDSSRTSLGGFTASLGASKVSGKHWLWEVYAFAESPGFELNDVGRLSTADEAGGYAQLRYRETTPRGALRRWDVFVTSNRYWNFGGTLAAADYYVDAEMTWKNFWRSVFTVFHVARFESSTASRGGPRVGIPSQWGGIASLSNSPSAPLRWNGRVYYALNEEGRPTYRLSGLLSLRPGPRWQLSVEPNFLRSTPMRQHVSTTDGGPAATFGKTYTFARIARTEFVVPIRLNYLFTPDLSLELYAEPFASSGRYFGFGTLPSAGSYELEPVEDTRELDFNVRSFRSNAVLRWEWRPGSTLFVVWQQSRDGDRERIAPVGPRSLLETLDTRGDNFLAVKVSYWLPIR